MKDENSESKLQRLFAMAQSGGEEPVEEMPGFLKTRILANWHAGAGLEDSWSALVMVFRRALVCASLATIFAVAWSMVDSNEMPLNDEALANYELRAEVMQ